MRSFFRLSGHERRTVFSAALRLVFLRLHFRRPRVGHKTDNPQRRIDPVRAQRLAHLVRRTAEELPFATTCLDRAFVLTSILESESLEATLRIGIRTERAEKLEAHAWVEHAGENLLVGDGPEYDSFEAPLTANWR
jgi:hypothetical protein